MGIECHHNGRSIDGLRVGGRSGNDGLMAAMYAVKNADREKDWSRQLRQLGNGMQRLQYSDE
jgi:hypothetical protein